MEPKLRKYVILGFFLTVFLIYLGKILSLQLDAEKYREQIYKNIVQEITIYPDRGLIIDAKGKVLAANKPVYTLKVIPRRMASAQRKKLNGERVITFDTTLMCQILDISKEEFEKRLQKAKDYAPQVASVFMKLIPEEQAALLKENMYKFPGFYLEKRSIRDYPLHTGAHFLGYLGEADTSDLKHNPNYELGDYIGKSGLEKWYDEVLRGQKGKKYRLLNKSRMDIGPYREGKYDVKAIPGYDLRTTIDADLQAYAEELMRGKVGAIVAIDPKTGGILTMVSSPEYDPNLLTGRDLPKNFRKLQRDRRHILMNRAITGNYEPGSTFKTLQALVALQENVITTSTSVVCSGGYRLGGTIVKCHHHNAKVNFHYSIQNSCNTYYCAVYMKLLNSPKYGNVHKAYDKWFSRMQEFGLGHKLGIDLPGESAGIFLNSDNLKRAFRDTAWRAGRAISMAIGQGNLSFTPLQIANYTATIANRGYYYTPHLVDKVGPQVKKYEKHYVSIDTAFFTPVIDAMEDVLKPGGTAPNAYVDDIKICGKTGTAQNPKGDDHSVFIAFAPKENPRIALVVYVENGRYGANIAAPIATLLIEKYIKGRVKNTYREQYVKQYKIDYSKVKF